MATRGQITFDAADPHALAAWWAARLDYRIEDGHDLISGLLEAGVVSESDVVRINGRLFFADAVAANDPDGSALRMFFQRVPEPKTAKNRLHLDVSVPAEHWSMKWTGGPQPAPPSWSIEATPDIVGLSCKILRPTSSASTDPPFRDQPPRTRSRRTDQPVKKSRGGGGGAPRCRDVESVPITSVTRIRSAGAEPPAPLRHVTLGGFPQCRPIPTRTREQP